MKRPARIQSEYALRITLILCLLFAFFSYKAFSENIEAALNAEEKARQTFRDQFRQFTTEKNVMGRATDADGNAFKAQGKNRFNPDDDNNFENDLTYHDDMFDSQIGVKDPKTGKTTGEIIQEGISKHGTISAGGGSSPLERKSWEWDDKLRKKDKDLSPAALEKNREIGIQLEGAMKITTLYLVDDPKNPDKKTFVGPGGTTAPDQKKIEVSRRELREEARQDLEKIGTNSAETIIVGARDADAKNDSSIMPNLTFMYETAKRALRSFWTNSLANLAQRRAFKNGDGIKLNEETPTCEVWQQREVARLQAEKLPPDIQKRRQADLERQTQQCKQLAEVDFAAVNPQFQADNNGPNSSNRGSGAATPAPEKLTTGDSKTEDSLMRDERAQLTVLSDVSKDLKSLPSNWGYKDDEEKAKVVVAYDERGNPAKEVDLTMREQVELFNDQRKGAKEDLAAIEKMVPQAKFDKSNLAPIDLEEKSALDLSELPASMKEELGSQMAPDEFLDSYNKMVKSNGGAKH